MKNKFIVFLLTLITFSTVILIAVATENSTITEENEKNVKPAEPQVIYIQYSTPEEAEEAKRQILAQYNALGAKAVISEDVSPFISVEDIVKNLESENVKDKIEMKPVEEETKKE